MIKANTNYQRVLPRDLFNEAKLLKSLGRLCLLIHDNQTPVRMSSTISNDEPFSIGLMDEGSLTITNLTIFIKKRSYRFKSTYNSKSNYPLYMEHKNCDVLVFDEQGNFDQEFIDFCKSL